MAQSVQWQTMARRTNSHRRTLHGALGGGNTHTASSDKGTRYYFSNNGSRVLYEPKAKNYCFHFLISVAVTDDKKIHTELLLN